MPRNQDKIPYQGRQSGKSSSTWFRNPASGSGTGMHPKGYGASAGDGRTSDTSILGKIKVVFRRGNR